MSRGARAERQVVEEELEAASGLDDAEALLSKANPVDFVAPEVGQERILEEHERRTQTVLGIGEGSAVGLHRAAHLVHDAQEVVVTQGGA